MLVIIDPTMPVEVRNAMFLQLSLLFPELKETDSKEEGIQNMFPALHCSWYNRYATHVSYCLINTVEISEINVTSRTYLIVMAHALMISILPHTGEWENGRSIPQRLFLEPLQNCKNIQSSLI
jgi:hypothetical protein